MALKLASTFITLTQAIKYTFIHATFLILWHFSLTAKKIACRDCVILKRTEIEIKYSPKDTKDIVSKYHRKGAKDNLIQETMLLDEKEKLQQQFKNTSKISCADVDAFVDNEEKMTFSKVGKVFCFFKELAFCVGSGLW